MNYIKILGASGSKAKGYNTTSFQIFKNIVIDAGNILNSLGNEASNIDHIFITHSHADHISDLPFVIETFYEKRKTPLTIYALKDTIDVLKTHSFNDKVWPDFTKINLLDSNKPSLILKEIQLEEEIVIDEYSIKPIYANHIDGSCGYVVTKNNIGFIISGDTYLNDKLVEELNKNKNIKALLIECSFCSKYEQLAEITKHLTPHLIKELLDKIKREDISTFFYHLKPLHEKQIKKELNALNLLDNGKILYEGDVIHIDTGTIEHNMITEDKFQEIMKINLALSSEYNKDKLLENILSLTRKFTNAQAGTLYIKSKDEKSLEFKVVQNDKLNIFMGGTKSKLEWPSLPIYLEDGSTNDSMVAVVCSNEKRIINIPDVYKTTKYQFDGTKNFDANTGYRSKSMLVIPLVNHEKEVIGVLQLINKMLGTKTIEFNKFDEKVITSLASQAAMALTNTQLILGLEDFINAFVSTIAKAIDAKSPYTKDHISKVEKIALLVAKAIHEDNTIYKDIKYDENMYKQIALAAWMHDIGKISMPEQVIDKATKLEKIYDRVELVINRFIIAKQNKKIEYLENKISKDDYEEYANLMDEYCIFIKKINKGAEFMSKEDENKLIELSKMTFEQNGKEEKLLSDDEFYNLSVKKGTLTKEEIEIIRNHAQLSLDMISELPFPKRYKNVLDIACNHHEKLDGKGYPRGLTEDKITLEDRIMILADIFEALTAHNRPYKDAMKLSKAKEILDSLANKGEIDKNLIDFFFNHNILMQYSKEELKPEQVDL